MAEHIYTFRVLLISPRDVGAEPDAVADVTTRWNAQIGNALQAHVELVRWETHGSPDMAGPAQEVLDRQIVDSCDLGIAIFWSRLGTPTRHHLSGSIEEIERLRSQNKRVMLYFCDRPVPSDVDLAEFQRVRDIRTRYERESYFGSYADTSDLLLSIPFHLTSAVKELLPTRPLGDRTSTALAQALTADATAQPTGSWVADAMPLRGRRELYAELSRLIKSTEGALHVRATSLLALRDRASDPVFTVYIAELAAKIAEARSAGYAASYSLVIGFPLGRRGAIPPDRRRAIAERADAFHEAGVGDAITVFHTPHQWPLDVLTINDEFAVIRFPGAAGDSHLRYALRVAGRQFVSQFAQWFDTCVLPEANLVDLKDLRIKP
jgi:hypothetical protein